MTVSKVMLTTEGPEISRIVQGFWRLAEWNMSKSEIQHLVNICLEQGITTFDHADIYGGYSCEGIFGEALADMSLARGSYQLVTKCDIKLVHPRRPEHTFRCYDTSRKHIIKSVENSLVNLHTDYLDVLLIHRPDPLMHADEVAGAFDMLKQSGKVLHFGVSNFLPSQFELLASRLDYPLVTNQIEYSVLNMDVQDNGTLDLCQKLRMIPMAWSPLGGGRLFTGSSEQIRRVQEALGEVAEQFPSASMDQVALAWILRHPVHFAIVIGTGKAARIQAAVNAEKINLTREQWFNIWTASTGHGVP